MDWSLVLCISKSVDIPMATINKNIENLWDEFYQNGSKMVIP